MNEQQQQQQMEWKKYAATFFKVIIFINGSMNMKNHFLVAWHEKWIWTKNKREDEKIIRRTNHDEV